MFVSLNSKSMRFGRDCRIGPIKQLCKIERPVKDHAQEKLWMSLIWCWTTSLNNHGGEKTAMFHLLCCYCRFRQLRFRSKEASLWLVLMSASRLLISRQPSHYTGEIWKAISTVRPSVQNNPSRKRSISLTASLVHSPSTDRRPLFLGLPSLFRSPCEFHDLNPCLVVLVFGSRRKNLITSLQINQLEIDLKFPLTAI